MKKILLLGTIFFLLFLTPRVNMAQPFVGTGSASPFGGALPGLANGGFHFHINPTEDHYAFESLDRHTHQYEALRGYEHIKSEKLQQVDRFKDIQYPKNQPYSSSSDDSFFGVQTNSPLDW
jgi:hypothetical protein